MVVAVCLKWVPRRVDIDPLDATATPDPNSWGPSAADEAALELALRVGDRRGSDVVALTVGPDAADAMLHDALSLGVGGARRHRSTGRPTSRATATALAVLAGDADLIICGDQSLDRGSGSVPAFIAAELGIAQVLGVASVTLTDEIIAERRTDRGGRDRVSVIGPTVLSVDGSLAIDGAGFRLRRAPLAALIESRNAVVDVRSGALDDERAAIVDRRPYRPRPRPVPSPDPSLPPLQRILELTDAVSDRTPPRTIEVDPAAAADAIIDQLRTWGYLDQDT
ncbi:MAG: hypothetical protein OEU32_08395 [Acidimicrobiia bacterium]|nr:hypothetical protein [Acidimicrobiia bacterium]